MPIVRIKTKGQVTLPAALRSRAGLEVGDFLEVKERGGKIVLSPKDIIDRRLDEALADIKAGRTYGPFNTADEGIKFLRSRTRKRFARR